MRKAAAILSGILVAALCAAPAGSAPQSRYVEPEPLGGLMDITYTGEPCPATPPDAGELIVYADPEACWFGTIEGDISGTVAFWEMDANYIAGRWMRFFEVISIQPDSGGYINGVQRGLWSLKTGAFSSSGWVASTSDEWSDLLGYRYHEAGTTSDPNVVPLVGSDTEWVMTRPGGA